MSTEHRDPEMDARLADWAEDRQLPPVRPDEAAQVQRVIAARMQERSRARLRQAMLLAAAILLAVLALRGQQPESPAPAPAAEIAQTQPAETPSEAPAPEVVAQAPQLEVLFAEGDAIEDARSPQVGAEGRMVLGLGEDRLGLGADSALRLEYAGSDETRLRLEQGVVAAQVASRGESGSFQILAGEAVVQVIGTRFGVLRGDGKSPLRVWVAEGIVEVRLGEVSWELKAGQQLELNEQGQGGLVPLPDADAELQALLSIEETLAETIPEPPAVPVGPTLDALRQQLAQGDLDSVLDQLEARLASQPEDVDAWSLLATTARKKGDTERQLRALQSVIRLDAGRPAQRARFEAAGLLSAEPQGKMEARLLLVDFLADPAGPGALEPDARMSLAWLELEAGDAEAARVQLDQITAKFPGTAPAVEAGKLRAQMAGK
jgi:tetratricopeptide (TPR) repeat protein